MSGFVCTGCGCDLPPGPAEIDSSEHVCNGCWKPPPPMPALDAIYVRGFKRGFVWGALIGGVLAVVCFIAGMRW